MSGGKKVGLKKTNEESGRFPMLPNELSSLTVGPWHIPRHFCLFNDQFWAKKYPSPLQSISSLWFLVPQSLIYFSVCAKSAQGGKCFMRRLPWVSKKPQQLCTSLDKTWWVNMPDFLVITNSWRKFSGSYSHLGFVKTKQIRVITERGHSYLYGIEFYIR